MIIYVTLLTASLSLLVLALVYAADLWEREPLDLIQNAFLVGLGTQLILVLGAHRLIGLGAGFLAWPLLTLTGLAIVLPLVLAEEHELDERFDGIVYAVSFGAGAASVVHLLNLPQAAARYPELTVLAGDATPGARDLLLLATAPGPRAELGQLLTLLAMSTLLGAVLGILKLDERPISQQIAAVWLTSVLLAGLDYLMGGGWPVRLLIGLVAAACAVALKRRSVFRERQQPPERDTFLGLLKTALLILGAIVLAQMLLMTYTDSWAAVTLATEGGPT